MLKLNQDQDADYEVSNLFNLFIFDDYLYLKIQIIFSIAITHISV